MKNYLLKFAFILVACVSFIACEDDTETEVNCTLETEVSFDVSGETQGREVTLIAPFFEEATYQWFINDEEIKAGSNKSQFLHVFEGEETKFDICVSVTKNGCEETNRACEVYEIQKMEDEDENMEECNLVEGIQMDRETKQEGREVKFVGPIYGFDGEDGFTGIKVNYKWYVNEELVKSGIGLNELIHVFGKDELVDNTVCLTISTEGCDEEFTACLKYNVPSNQGCDLPLDFTIEKIGDQKVKLTVLEGPKDSGYVWTVSGQTFETSIGEFIYDDAQDGDEFCLFVETPDCPKGKQVCETYQKEETETKEQVCTEFSLVIEAARGLDIFVNVINDEDLGKFTFAWSVNNITTNNFKSTGNQDDIEALSLQWGPRDGVTEFCYTVFTDECEEGVTKCVTMEVTELQIDKANTSVGGKLPAIGIKKLENGSYTYDIEDL